MPAGADDDDVVFLPRLGRGPLLLPALVAAHGFAGDGKYRIFPHDFPGLANAGPGIIPDSEGDVYH